MKTSRIIQYAVAATMFSAGCWAMLEHNFFLSTIYFCLPGVVMITRSNFQSPVTRKELNMLLGSLAVICPGWLFTIYWVPEQTLYRIAHEPAFVLPLWCLMMLGLVRQWRKERKLSKQLAQIV